MEHSMAEFIIKGISMHFVSETIVKKLCKIAKQDLANSVPDFSRRMAWYKIVVDFFICQFLHEVTTLKCSIKLSI